VEVYLIGRLKANTAKSSNKDIMCKLARGFMKARLDDNTWILRIPRVG